MSTHRRAPYLGQSVIRGNKCYVPVLCHQPGEASVIQLDSRDRVSSPEPSILGGRLHARGPLEREAGRVDSHPGGRYAETPHKLRVAEYRSGDRGCDDGSHITMYRRLCLLVSYSTGARAGYLLYIHAGRIHRGLPFYTIGIRT